MHFLNYVGDSLYFDLDIEIHDNIDFLKMILKTSH